MTINDALELFAPAKVNLYLHITGQRSNGYHDIDSLIVFADVGDFLKITPANNFNFVIEGPFSHDFPENDRKSDPESSNLVVRGVYALSKAAKKTPDLKITLRKNLPLTAGIGGGSSDAAAALRGLIKWWGLPSGAPYIEDIATSLGADVPVCLGKKPAQISGVGEIMTIAPLMPDFPVILVNPLIACPTPEVFKTYSTNKTLYKNPLILPDFFSDFTACVTFLKKQHNDLYTAALKTVPQIENIISALEAENGCALARLSGSGATCFGLFETPEKAKLAEANLKRKHPDWWIQKGTLNKKTLLA